MEKNHILAEGWGLKGCYLGPKQLDTVEINLTRPVWTDSND